MTRKVTEKDQLCWVNGIARRTIGRFRNNKGKIAPKKFMLGRDPDLARIANIRLQRLWSQIVERYSPAQYQRVIPAHDNRMLIVEGPELITISADDHGPLWNSHTLKLAEAIRLHQSKVVFTPEELGVETSEDYAFQLHWLRQRFGQPGLEISGQDDNFVEQGLRRYENEVDVMLGKAKALQKVAAPAKPVDIQGTLYQAFETYKKWAEKHHVQGGEMTEHGRKIGEYIKAFREASEDMPLTDFGYTQIEKIKDFYCSRPKAKQTGKPISIYTVRNRMQAFRQFIQWLHRTPDFAWRKPPDVEAAMKFQTRRLLTAEEISKLKKSSVGVWNVQELTTLYREATDEYRLLILLGLCCGFAQAEICSLCLDEIDLEAGQIERIRRKSQVQGKLLMWPELIKGIRWHFAQTSSVRLKDTPYVILTPSGQPMKRQGISNRWNRLLDKVKQAQEDFNCLSFKHLRKTASQMIRDVADGEIAGVFIFHGKPVATDELSDAYSNRPFDKVFEAQREVRKQLKPMFDAAPDAFEGRSKRVTRKTKRTSQKIGVR